MRKRFKVTRKQFGFSVFLVVWLSMFIFITGCAKDDATLQSLPINKIVLTAFGAVQGTTLNDVWVWKGIPYAKPPVGDLRWRAPVDPEAWTGVKETSTACSECMQQVYDPHWFSSNAFIGSEDCLYVDIYAPRTWRRNLPVYVYIHGGSNNFGSAKKFDGSALAQRENILVVYVQYRLNAMGFLTHPALRTGASDFDNSGNYGLLDIFKALSWVQNNIAAFGGDPDQVVVGGQSAGAYNVMNLLTSPQAANFHGVFLQSVPGPGVMDLSTVAASDAWTNTTIDGLLIRNGMAADAATAAVVRAGMSLAEIEAFMKSQTAELVLRCRRDGTGADGTGLMAFHSAIRDGIVVRDATWLEAIAAGSYHKVPMVNGGTRYEWHNFAPLYGTYVKAYTGGLVPSGTYSWFQLFNVIGVLTPLLTADQVLPLQADKDFYATLTDLRSRHIRLNGLDDVVRALKIQDATNVVYAFQFKWTGGGDPALADFSAYFGAGHSMDIPFFQGNDADIWDGYSFTAANEPGRVALQEVMMDYLGAFVKTLNPNPAESDLLIWPQWDMAEGGTKTISFNATLTDAVLDVETTEVTADALNAEIAAAKVTYPFALAWFVNGL